MVWEMGFNVFKFKLSKNYMKRFLFYLFIFFSFNVFSQTTDWVKSFGGDLSDKGISIGTDSLGYIYISGYFNTAADFGGGNASNGTSTLSHKQKRDVFVAKCTPDGEWIWAKRARSSGVDKAYQMFVDYNSQVYICGTTSDTTIFSQDVVVIPPNESDTTSSAFVAQLDGNGNGEWLWAKVAGTTSSDEDRTNDICADGFGNVYAVGFYENEATFDDTTLTAVGSKDIFLWKLQTQEMPGNCEHDIVAVNELDIPVVNIYPNPVRHHMTIAGAGGFEVRITDTFGRLIFTKTIIGDKELLEVSGFSAGIYFLTFYKEGVKVLTKMVVISNFY